MPTPPRKLEALNPADYFTLAMDNEIRLDGMPGSLGSFALELENQPDITILKQRIDEFAKRFPVAKASLQQQGRRFFWFERDTDFDLLVQEKTHEPALQLSKIQNWVDNIMHPTESRNELPPIQFFLLISQSTSLFLMRWIHPVCDAKGADLILKFLCTDDKDARDLFQSSSEPLVISTLKKFRWWQKIGLFLKAKNHIQSLDQLTSIIPTKIDKPPARLAFAIRQLTPQQSQQIVQQARKHCGMIGTSLYYLGCMMRALERMPTLSDGDGYCVPYAYNLRKQKALSPVLGNHVGPLFAQASREQIENRKTLFKHLKQSYAQVIRQQLDFAFFPVMWAASWLSLEKHGQQLRKSYQSNTERSSFWFSDIGQLDFSQQKLAGQTIKNVFHLCQITTPPGLALLCCQFQGQLTLSYSYMTPHYDEAWIDQVHHYFKTELMGEQD